MADSAKIDDAIKREDLRIPFSIFNVYEQRVVERMNMRALCSSRNSISVRRKTYSLLRDDEPWPQSEGRER
jgi:carboxyl-terminal processing protease